MLHYFRKRSTCLTLATLLLVIMPFSAICFANADKIFKMNNKGVVVIMAFDDKGKAISQGSGFIVRTDGVVVTNYHVISNSKSIKIKTGNKIFNVDGIINLDKENDIAILKADANNLPTVKLGDPEKIGIGERLYVISSPQGLENSISDGILSGKREIGKNKKILQITAPISSGSSGSPVFDKNGEVIGITTFLLKESQNLNFALPVDIIKDKILSQKVIPIKDSQIEDYQNIAEYWFNRGLAYQEADMHREAIDAYKQSIRIKPGVVEPYINLGSSYSKMGMHQQALEAIKQAILIEPDDADAYFALGVTYGKMRMYSDEIEAYKRAVILKPDLTEAYNNMGVAYLSLGRLREAEKAFEQATRLKPDHSTAHFGLGITYRLLNDYSGALIEYGILLKIDPQMAQKLLDRIYKK